MLAKIIKLTGLGAVLFTALFSYVIWADGPKKTKKEIDVERVTRIYRNVLAATGEINVLPKNVRISSSTEVNAYADTNEIVINQGFIDYVKSDDEIALVLGHEMAHVTLGHVYIEGKVEWWNSSVMEAQADKMGAFYMIKAGYDVCKGRELYLRWLKEGQYLFATHPNYSYRYSELNINCSNGV